MKNNRIFLVVVFLSVLFFMGACAHGRNNTGQGEGQNQPGRQMPSQTDSSLNYSLKYIEGKKFDDAVKVLDQEIARNPKSDSLYNLRGRAFFGKKMYDRALEDFNKALAISPNNPETYINIGNYHLAMWDIDNARKQFDKALEKKPDDVGALHGIGICYAKKLDYPTAIVWYDKVLKLDPQNSGCYDNRAFANYYTMKYDESMSDFNKSIEIDPSFSHSYFGRARIFIKDKKWKEAFSDLDNAIKYENDFFEAYVARGTIYADRFDYEKALKDFDFAIKLKPDSTIAHYERGQVNLWMGKFDKAKADFKIAAQAKTKVYTFSVREVDISGSVMLANAINDYMMGINNDKTRQLVKKGIEKTEKLDNPLDNENCNIGYGYYILGDYYKAVENFDAALAFDPEMYKCYYGRALALLKLGKKKEAVDDLVKSAKNLPNIWLKQKSLEILKNQNYDLKNL